MATVAAWVEATRNLLMGGRQEERNTLAANYTAGSGTLAFTYGLGGIVAGSRLSIGTNTFYVVSVAASGQTATVLGGQEGTTDANAATGALVRVAPRFTDADIFTALGTDLGDLSSPEAGLFQIKTADITYSTAKVGFDLAGVTDLLDIYEVRYQDAGTASDWPMIPKVGWRLDRSADTTVFPSGLALQVFSPAAAGLKLRVLYRAPFTVPTATSDDQATTGLPTTAYDLPPMGAAVRLMVGREVKRNFTEAQGDTRRAAEVPPGAVGGSYRGLAALREQRVQAEAARLMARYPDRRW